MSDSLRAQELQCARLLCPPLSTGVCSNSYPLSQWCYLTISSSATNSPQSFQASESPPTSWLFVTGGQSTGASASASVVAMNIQAWFPLGLTGLISLLSKWLSRVFSSTKVWKYQLFSPYPIDARCTCPTQNVTNPHAPRHWLPNDPCLQNCLGWEPLP